MQGPRRGRGAPQRGRSPVRAWSVRRRRSRRAATAGSTPRAGRPLRPARDATRCRWRLCRMPGLRIRLLKKRFTVAASRLGQAVLEHKPVHGADRRLAHGRAARARSRFPLTMSLSRRSARTRAGNVSPCPTSVTNTMPTASRMTRSRYGNGSPFGSATGIASAAASETTPRIPHQPTSVDTRAEAGSRRCSDGMQPADPVGRGEDPRESHADGDQAQDRDQACNPRPGQLPDGPASIPRSPAARSRSSRTPGS